MSNEKNLGCLWYIGDYTTQLFRDYNKPIIRVPTKQPLFHGMSTGFGSRCSSGENNPWVSCRKSCKGHSKQKVGKRCGKLVS